MVGPDKLANGSIAERKKTAPSISFSGCVFFSPNDYYITQACGGLGNQTGTEQSM